MGQWKHKWRAKDCPNGHEYSPENTAVGSKGERVCKACQRERMRRKRESPDFLERARIAAQKHREANRAQVNARAAELRRLRREWTDEFKSALSCGKCGEKHPACLEFHHRDPASKDINVSVALAHWSMKRIRVEVDKCDVLCSNCHRKLHWEQRQHRE